MNSMRKRIRNLGAVVLATAALGLGGAATASAQPARAPFTTPHYGMSCTTWVTGSFGSYYGHASCTEDGYWYLRVNCTAGFSYNSPQALQDYPGERSTRSAGSCYWGVSSMQIVEIPA
jgi:hypothetical protein